MKIPYEGPSFSPLDYKAENWRLKKKVEDLEARIKLALRLNHANLPGFFGDALRGDKLENIPLIKGFKVLEYLTAIEKEDLE